MLGTKKNQNNLPITRGVISEKTIGVIDGQSKWWYFSLKNKKN